jgi:hypothetical protein
VNICATCKKPFIAKFVGTRFCGKGGKKCTSGKPAVKRKWNRKTLKVLSPGEMIKVVPLPDKKRKEQTPLSRDRYYRKTYGITLDQYNQMELAQDGRCGICGGVAKILFVDHCHTTGRVRGLLCIACNSGLGHFRDSIGALRTAIIYLEKR